MLTNKKILVSCGAALAIAALLWLHDSLCPTWWFITSQEHSYTLWQMLCATCSTLLYMLFGAVSAWAIPLMFLLPLLLYHLSIPSTKHALYTIKLVLGALLLSMIDAHFILMILPGIPAGGLVGWYGLKLAHACHTICATETLLLIASIAYAISIVGCAWARPLQRFILYWYQQVIVTSGARFCIGIQQVWYTLISTLSLTNSKKITVPDPCRPQMPAPQMPAPQMPAFQEAAPQKQGDAYQKPSLEKILGPVTTPVRRPSTHYKEQARILEDTLRQFGVQGTVTEIIVGPVVILYEYQPAKNVAMSKIRTREHDLMRALQVVNLRILAPIPGRSVVGFECTRPDRDAVLFGDQWHSLYETDAQLPLLLGVTTDGKPLVIDLATLPHLLIAGSTGSGKSVTLNGMIMSLLVTALPQNVRLILIDPKRLEFAWYTDIAHLLFPIVTDPGEAIRVLRWVVEEMERRYTLMSQAEVTHSKEYRAAGNEMPDIVVVIDEWADLIMTGGKEVEGYVIRLTQMARAAGIHVILATQRPSVNVLTGLIKVNIPARIACRVTSQIDSRTILGIPGAETLSGKGDMLVMLPGKPIERMHGIYMSNQEIQAITCAIRRQGGVAYIQKPTENTSLDNDMSAEDTVLYKQVLEVIRNADEISISLLQRRLRIGYNRSARMIDYLEARGMILPSDGGKMRKVLRN